MQVNGREHHYIFIFGRGRLQQRNNRAFFCSFQSPEIAAAAFFVLLR